MTNWRSDSIKKPEGFKKESFVYYEEANCYICPMGSVLRYSSFCSSTGLFLYRSDPKICAHHGNRGRCIDGKKNVRAVSRHPNETSRERNIAKGHTEEGRAILCRGKGKAHVKVIMGQWHTIW